MKKDASQLKKEYLQKISNEFPKLKIYSSRLFTHGSDHDVVFINDSMVFRFPKSKKYVQTFKREIKFLSSFSKMTQVSVPRYTFVAKNYLFGGYKKKEGHWLTKNLYGNLDSFTQEVIARQLAHFLTLLHHFPLREARKMGFSEEWPISKQIRAYQKRKKEIFSVLSEKEKIFVEKFIEGYAHISVPRLALLHYDLSKDHILVKDGRVEGIIDFGDSALGDPAADFAWLWELGEKFVTTVYNEYNGLKDHSFLSRSQLYHDAMYLSWIYHGVHEKKKKLLQRGLRELRKIVKN
ncbi:aminoglycoside phosphotransferase family protein [Candidatus Woesearchaeota archaeon]|nr:aminoglycoside phosphotransferase family protein [Candidatus Woesearchaeota archaeon]